MATAGKFERVRVWVKELAGSVPNYRKDTWTPEPRLVPLDGERLLRGDGAHNFRLVRKERRAEIGLVRSTYEPVVGQYIAVTTDDGASPENLASTVHWVGAIQPTTSTPIRGENDAVGTVVARGLRSVLEDVPVRGIRQVDPNAASADAEGVELFRPPPFNLKGNGGKVVGNAVSGPTDDDGNVIRQLASSNDELGTLFTRRMILDHLMFYSIPDRLPPITIDDDLVSLGGSPLDASAPVSYDLSGMSLAAALDTLIPQSQGMSWDIFIFNDKWHIKIFSITDTATPSVPAASPTDVDLLELDADLSITKIPQFDAVEVVGGPCIFGGTVGKANSSTDKAWTSADETTFKNAAGNGDTEENQRSRKNPDLRDVFTRHEIVQKSSRLVCKGASGDDWNTDLKLAPKVNWNGSSATISTTEDATPSIPASRILDWIPHNVGSSDVPKYASPIVTRKDTDAGRWYDLADTDLQSWETIETHVEEAGLRIRAAYEYPEKLASEDWSGADASAEDPTSTATEEAGDWRDLAFTVAIETDQRVRVRINRGSLTDADAGLVMRLDRPDLQYWVMRQFSIIGVKADGTPNELGSDTVVRDDWAQAQRLAEEAQAFAFKERSIIQLALARPDDKPAWAQLGTLVGDIVEFERNSSGTFKEKIRRTISTVVNRIRFDWNPERPRLIVGTGEPVVAVGSDAVTRQAMPGLGATLPVAVNRIQESMGKLEQAQRQRPIRQRQRPVPDTGGLQVPMASIQEGDLAAQIFAGFPGVWMMPPVMGLPDSDPDSLMTLAQGVNQLWIDTGPTLKVTIKRGTGGSSSHVATIAALSALDTAAYVANDIYHVGVPQDRDISIWADAGSLKQIMTMTGGEKWAPPHRDLRGVSDGITHPLSWDAQASKWRTRIVSQRSDHALYMGLGSAQIYGPHEYDSGGASGETYVDSGGTDSYPSLSGWPVAPTKPPLSDIGYGQTLLVRGYGESTLTVLHRDTSGTYYSADVALTSWSISRFFFSSLVAYDQRHTAVIAYDDSTNQDERLIFRDDADSTAGANGEASGYYLDVG